MFITSSPASIVWLDGGELCIEYSTSIRRPWRARAAKRTGDPVSYKAADIHRELRSPAEGSDASWLPKRIAIVHDWCPDFRGGERVLAELCKIFPGAEVFTLFDFLADEVKQEHFPGVIFHTSIANRLPKVRKFYRSLFPICPILIEQFDLTDFDAVITSSAAFARGVLTRPDQPHLCYVHSPIRYAWDEQFSYLKQGHLGYGPKGLLFRYCAHKLRTWDVRTANGPDLMLANSSYVRSRIKRVYGRKSEVVFPPVPIDELQFSADKDDYYVTASFLAPYKRTDLVIQAFTAMPARHLIVVGDGQQMRNLRKLAGSNVTFAGFLPRAEYLNVVARARAMVFAGCEDFGIALVEAQGSGTPLIAFGRGGATDIVRPLGLHEKPTGVLFHQQSTAAVVSAVERFEENSRALLPAACRENAARFGPLRFARQVSRAFAATVSMHNTFAGAERTVDWRNVLQSGAGPSNAIHAASVDARS